MNIMEEIKLRAKNNLKTIILPESEDERVVEAARIATNEQIAKIILIGETPVDNILVINPKTYPDTNKMIDKLYELRKEKGLTYEEAKELIMNDHMYFACMLVYIGIGDGIVSGACHSTKNTLKPALQIIKTKPSSKLVSAFFLMNVPNCSYGSNGTFIFSDAGLNQNPTSEELAYIAKDSADSFELLTGKKSITAFLSHSTYGSASHADVTKVVEAVKIAKNNYPEYLMDGEFQLDAAIVPEVSMKKAPESRIKGQANVLIFPDLDSGNIGYKLVERLAKAEAYGPITQGIKKPVNDLSRGCKTLDIVGVIAITSVQAE